MQMGQDAAYYLNLAKRRYPYFLIPFVLVFVIGFAVALLLPPIYRSSATLLLQSQKIPENLVQSTVASFANERIQVISQRTMTRDNLLRIADKFALFSAYRSNISATEIVDIMREGIEIKPIPLAFRAKRRRDRSQTTIAFTVSFEHNRPDLAAKVANELVTLILSEDARTRLSRASETTQFLKREAERLEKDLLKTEAEISAFKQKHKDALPEGLAYRLIILERARSELQEIDKQIIAAASGGTSQSPSSPLQQLALLKAELAKKSAIFGKRHPEIKALTRQIAVLQTELGLSPNKAKKLAKKRSPAGGVAPDAAAPAADPETDIFARAPAALRAQRKRAQKKIAAIQALIDQTPAIEQMLNSMSRRYGNTKQRFEELVRKQQQALLGERLEEDKQTERFEVIEQPVQPQVPIKPNRKKILALSLFLALAAGAGCVFLIEALDKSIRSAADLLELTNRRPLVSIPYIVTRQELQLRKKQNKFAFAAAGASLVIVFLGVHLFYQPLDVLFFKVITRLQL